MSASDLYGIHEDRITRLEDGLREISNQLAANTVQIEHLDGRLHDGFERIQERLQVLHSKLDSIGTVQADHRERLTALEGEAKRAKGWLKVVGGAVAAVAGWIAKAIVTSHLG